MELKIYNPQEEGFLKEIDWNYEELKIEIQGKANDYMNLVYTADQVKDAKKDRANLNKFVEALESKRKEIKKTDYRTIFSIRETRERTGWYC